MSDEIRDLRRDLAEVQRELARHDARSEHYLTERRLREIIGEEVTRALLSFGHETASQIDKRVVRHESERHVYDDDAVTRQLDTRTIIFGAVALLVIGALAGRLVFAVLEAVLPDMVSGLVGF